MTLKNARIMLVDTSKAHAAEFRAALENNGYHTDAFHDPIQALETFSKGAYKVVIVDAMISEITGFEFARHINRLDEAAKIVLMTPFSMSKTEFDMVVGSTCRCNYQETNWDDKID